MSVSPLASPSATIDVLKRHGLYTRKALGQHLLVDDNVVRRIVELAALHADECVLEIGPGIGTLTLALCDAAGSVVAVEQDDRLLPVLAEHRRNRPTLHVVHADAVTVPVEGLTDGSRPPSALVANLPYAVAATLVLRFFEETPSLETATVMVQAEVADRMSASPGTKAYGAYTVKLQLLAQPAGRFGVARTCFLPPPRVDSAVLRLERRNRPEPAGVLRAAARIAEAGFGQRRKTLRNSLGANLGLALSDVDAMLDEAGADGGRRAETFSVDEYLRLAEVYLRQSGQR